MDWNAKWGKIEIKIYVVVAQSVNGGMIETRKKNIEKEYKCRATHFKLTSNSKSP